MGTVTEICNPSKIWTLEEANQQLPLIRWISAKTDAEVDGYLKKQRALLQQGAPKEQINKLDIEVTTALIKLGRKAARLGISISSGVYLFYCYDGYFSWMPGEPTVGHYHMLTEAPFQRRAVAK